ncbi:MAG: hypothetical protein AMXMBFR64_23100 [Myxococcales bacterium]
MPHDALTRGRSAKLTVQNQTPPMLGPMRAVVKDAEGPVRQWNPAQSPEGGLTPPGDVPYHPDRLPQNSTTQIAASAVPGELAARNHPSAMERR